MKRTYEALTDLIEDTQLEIDHLDSIATALDIAETEADLQQIKEEMMESGYIKHKYSKKKTQGRADHIITVLPTDLTFMLEKITSRTMN